MRQGVGGIGDVGVGGDSPLEMHTEGDGGGEPAKARSKRW